MTRTFPCALALVLVAVSVRAEVYYGSPTEGKLSTYFPRFQTPGCSYGEDPSVEDLKAHPDLVPLMLQECTQPIPESAVDMRGLWMDPVSGHVERIEQCGIRIIVTSEGVIHDCFLANGRQEDGVIDVAGCGPINPAGLFQPEQRRFTLYPNGVPTDDSSGGIVVIRQLIADDKLQWIHPIVGVTNMTRQTGAPLAADGIYYGNPAQGKLSTYIPRIQTPGCSYGEDPSVEDSKAHPDLAPLQLQECTQPIPESAVDMRGLWMDPVSGHVERIEQCGIRIIVTSEGVIHDCFLANGRQEDGVIDVAGCGPINPAGLFQPEQRRFTLYPNGVPTDDSSGGIVVIRQLIADDKLQWIHPIVGITNMTRQTGAPLAADGIYYGNPVQGKLSTYIPRIQTPGCSYGEDPTVSDTSLSPMGAPLQLQECTQPIPVSAVDMRGLWEDPTNGKMERIEQCGLRIIITSSGIIHDTFVANGWDEYGVIDVSGNSCEPINPSGLFSPEDHAYNFSVNGTVVVSRTLLDANTLRWVHPLAGIVDFTRVNADSSLPPDVPLLPPSDNDSSASFSLRSAAYHAMLLLALLALAAHF